MSKKWTGCRYVTKRPWWYPRSIWGASLDGASHVISIPLRCCMKMCNQPCPVLEGCTRTRPTRGQSLLWQRWAHVLCRMAPLQSYESAQKHPCGHVSAGVAALLVVVSKTMQAHVALASDLSKPTYAILSEPFTSAMVWCGRRKHWLLQCQDILDEPANTYNLEWWLLSTRIAHTTANIRQTTLDQPTRAPHWQVRKQQTDFFWGIYFDLYPSATCVCPVAIKRSLLRVTTCKRYRLTS